MTITRLSALVLCVLFIYWRYGMDTLKCDLPKWVLTGGKSVELGSDSAINTYPKAAPTLCRLQYPHQYKKKTKYRMSLKVLINVILRKERKGKKEVGWKFSWSITFAGLLSAFHMLRYSVCVCVCVCVCRGILFYKTVSKKTIKISWSFESITLWIFFPEWLRDTCVYPWVSQVA